MSGFDSSSEDALGRNVKELAMKPSDEVINLLEEAKKLIQMANTLSSEKQYRIAVFDRPLSHAEFPLTMICEVEVDQLQGPRLPDSYKRG